MTDDKKGQSSVQNKSEAVDKAKNADGPENKPPELTTIARRPLRRSLIGKKEGLDPHGGKVVTSGAGIVRERQ